ncbi:MAG: transport system ATPase [Rubrobacteraceae bacterium]|nr:transport system ATPase [Rubrobacteraceae bacterium]
MSYSGLSDEDTDVQTDTRVTGGDGLVERLLSGDRRALARVISKIERGDPETHGIVSEIYSKTGTALSVGFTGPPGVGKSSIIAKLIELYRKEDRRVGVVSVDPSSPFSRGAILGDRIRLSDHFLDPGVFIRSMGSRGHLGGLAGASRLAALAMEAAGMDVVLYETVGVGQGEVEVASAADTVVLALQPGAGDAVQALKAGVMEIADIFCINKADHPQAKGAANEVRSILDIGQELDPQPWFPPIIMTRGDTGEGVEELKETIQKHRSYLEESGRLEERRRASLKEFVISWAKERLEREMHHRLEKEDDELMEKVYGRELDPISASEKIFREV